MANLVTWMVHRAAVEAFAYRGESRPEFIAALIALQAELWGPGQQSQGEL